MAGAPEGFQGASKRVSALLMKLIMRIYFKAASSTVVVPILQVYYEKFVRTDQEFEAAGRYRELE
jgi:hypothetical protein